MASSLTLHQRLGTIERCVDRVICVSEVVRDKLVAARLPSDRLVVKPNAVEDLAHAVDVTTKRVRQIVFVGRLAPEKGVRELIQAWKSARLAGWRLVIIGDGPERAVLESLVQDEDSVVFLGWLGRKEVASHLACSRFLVVPSLWYETFALGVTEAQSLSTPSIAPAHGPFVERIVDGKTGILFNPSGEGGLLSALRKASELHEREWRSLADAARTYFEEQLAPNGGAEGLIRVFEEARRVRTERGSRCVAA